MFLLVLFTVVVIIGAVFAGMSLWAAAHRHRFDHGKPADVHLYVHGDDLVARKK